MLELTSIQKSFNDKPVLDIPLLRLDPGIYWLKGANGSGKSTLFKMLAGLLPGKGEISIQGVSQLKQPVAYRQLINHSPAEPVFPAFITGDELISFVSSVKKGGPEQVDEIRRRLEIGNYTANPTGSYSSGMLKKLSLLLAFIGQPAWILLDEPFTTLDTQAQQRLHTLISDRHKAGTSFIITSHHDLETPDLKFDGVFRITETQLKKELPV
ncbi:ABC transporter ATP-binding protein [Terrimonas sp. NA20]|uniref:ABC transporter ATP-binding protein n=1 Tax=Terrimonas ginsenosidimutans TaxID=2908004 RepID=A0ABS9KZ29_9BACT|nr:ABC transporter ATP-binding protein [Terrimonas ginsenosidimutans]MCG2617568.1 ABC transporter ATP-binding protein [Terrimonas ginsenosidimutans]